MDSRSSGFGCCALFIFVPLVAAAYGTILWRQTCVPQSPSMAIGYVVCLSLASVGACWIVTLQRRRFDIQLLIEASMPEESWSEYVQLKEMRASLWSDRCPVVSKPDPESLVGTDEDIRAATANLPVDVRSSLSRRVGENGILLLTGEKGQLGTIVRCAGCVTLLLSCSCVALTSLTLSTTQACDIAQSVVCELAAVYGVLFTLFATFRYSPVCLTLFGYVGYSTGRACSSPSTIILIFVVLVIGAGAVAIGWYFSDPSAVAREESAMAAELGIPTPAAR